MYTAAESALDSLDGTCYAHSFLDDPGIAIPFCSGELGMRNMLALVGAAVVTVVGLGWYLDWFHVHRESTGEGKSSYNVQVNDQKIKEDVHKGEEKLHDIIEKKTATKVSAAEGPEIDPSTSDSTSNLEPPPAMPPGSPVEKLPIIPEGPVVGGPDLMPPSVPEPPK
jgi:hypothetical protein